LCIKTFVRNQETKMTNICGDTRTDREIMAEMGARLKTLRKARGLTLAAVADLTDMNKSTVSRAEGGENPTLLTILRLLRAYGRVDALDGFIPSPELSPMDLLAESRKRSRD
jgi:transcriptional regulator with XRE-family HTH domain